MTRSQSSDADFSLFSDLFEIDSEPLSETPTEKPKKSEQKRRVTKLKAAKAATNVDVDAENPYAGLKIVSGADQHHGSPSNYGLSLPMWDTDMDCPSSWAQSLRSTIQMVDLCNEIQATHLVLAGDLFDISNPKPEVVARVLEQFDRLETAKIIVVNGNHDQAHVHAGQRTPIDAYIARHSKVLYAASGPEVIEDQGVSFALLPWMRVAGSLESTETSLAENIERLADSFKTQAGLFVSHCVVEGSMPLARGTEEFMSPGQAEAPIPIKLLEEGPWSTARLGHIHTRQQLSPKVGYEGSSYKVSFNEVDEDKGVSVITFNSDGSANIEFHKLQVRELWQMHALENEPLLTPDMFRHVKHNDIVRLILAEPEAHKPVFDYLNEIGAIVDVRRPPAAVRKAAIRVPGLTFATKPKDALRAYAEQQKTDAKLLKSALALFEEIVNV